LHIKHYPPYDEITFRAGKQPPDGIPTILLRVRTEALLASRWLAFAWRKAISSRSYQTTRDGDSGKGPKSKTSLRLPQKVANTG